MERLQRWGAVLAVAALCSLLIGGQAWADAGSPLVTVSDAKLIAPDESANEDEDLTAPVADKPSSEADGASATSGENTSKPAAKKTKKPAKQAPPIKDGVYRIGVLGGTTKRLESMSDTKSAAVRASKANSSLAQRWQVTRGHRGYYTITNVASGFKLGVNSKNVVAAGSAKSLDNHGTRAFKWAISKNKSGTFQLVNLASGRALAVTSGKVGGVKAAKAAAKKRSQKFVFKRSAIAADGVYSLYTKLAKTRRTVRIEKGSIAQNAAARIGKRTGALCEKFKVTRVSGSVYAIQAAESGRYLADRDGKVCQRARAKSGKLSKAQLWEIGVRNGLTFTNVATGKALTVSGGQAKPGVRLVARKPTGRKSQLYRIAADTLQIDEGLYTVGSRAGRLRLDIAGASWDSGVNVQAHRSNDSIAQKFEIRATPSGKYYRFVMPLAGTALGVDSAEPKANARMERLQAGASTQLWRPIVTDAGLSFANKVTGSVLGIDGKVRQGANATVAPSRGKSAQAWRLNKTKLNMKTLPIVRALVDRAPGGGNRSVKLDAKGTGYRVSAARLAQLNGALNEAWKRGEDVSFVMVDLDTGVTLSCGADRDNHGASTFKAAYVTYIYQDILERRGYVDASTHNLMWQTVSYSSNEAYQALRNRYGSGGFRSWLNGVGLGYLADQWYPRLSARNLARVWTKIYAYEHSGGAHVGAWRRLFDHSYYSFIRESLGGSNAVYSKPGWYPRTGNLAALNDGAIVKSRDGRTYLLSMISNTNCYSDRWLMRNVARALDAVHREMPRSRI